MFLFSVFSWTQNGRAEGKGSQGQLGATIARRAENSRLVTTIFLFDINFELKDLIFQSYTWQTLGIINCCSGWLFIAARAIRSSSHCSSVNTHLNARQNTFHPSRRRAIIASYRIAFSECLARSSDHSTFSAKCQSAMEIQYYIQ